MNSSRRISSQELGAFLRSRRDRLRPSDVGLPEGNRRRVPGLRREEVAVLAHVGTTWYTWLEQGRDIRTSEDVLVSIADALLLNGDERAHLFHLGGHLERAAAPGDGVIGTRLRTMLDKVMPYPAMVHDTLYQWQAYNQTYRHLVDDADEVSPGSCVVELLENPRWQHAFRHDENELRVLVGKLRVSFGEFPDDPRWPDLLSRLRRHESFRRLWDSGEVVRETSTAKIIDNPWVGTLRLHSIGLIVQEDRRLTLSVHQPRDAATAKRLEQLKQLIENGDIEPGT